MRGGRRGGGRRRAAESGKVIISDAVCYWPGANIDDLASNPRWLLRRERRAVSLFIRHIGYFCRISRAGNKVPFRNDLRISYERRFSAERPEEV